MPTAQENFINHIRNYISLNEEEAPQVLEAVKVSCVRKKNFLLREGQMCKANYFVSKGLLRMFFINDKGVEQITQFALENWWVADYMSLITQTTATFSIQAIEDSEIVELAYDNQDGLFHRVPQLERYFRIMMQRAYAAAQLRVKYFHDYSKEENYRQFVTLFPRFVQRIPQYMLASYLGLTPEYLSELRRTIKPNPKKNNL